MVAESEVFAFRKTPPWPRSIAKILNEAHTISFTFDGRIYQREPTAARSMQLIVCGCHLRLHTSTAFGAWGATSRSVWSPPCLSLTQLLLICCFCFFFFFHYILGFVCTPRQIFVRNQPFGGVAQLQQRQKIDIFYATNTVWHWLWTWRLSYLSIRTRVRTNRIDFCTQSQLKCFGFLPRCIMGTVSGRDLTGNCWINI